MCKLQGLDKLNKAIFTFPQEYQTTTTTDTSILSTLMTYCNGHVETFRPGMLESRVYICITQLHVSETVSFPNYSILALV